MRPASSIAPDGPQNILDAVALACTARVQGVFVVCAGIIHSALHVQKVHPCRLDAFDSGEAGPLGYVEQGCVRWVKGLPVNEVDVRLVAMNQLPIEAWPRVEIVMNYAGATGATVRALCGYDSDGAPPVRGIVVAGTGNGTMHADLESALKNAHNAGVRVVRSTRCAYGAVVSGGSELALPDSKGLSPVKARIALMLELLN
jgi:L-asparaginase